MLITRRLSNLRFSSTLLAVGLLIAVFLGSSAGASHSWGNYHWARQSNPFTLKLGRNLTSSWQPYLATASTDWSVSTVLDTTVVAGTKNPKTCKPTLGRVEVCNSKYGNNGWLGLAQIWINSSSHIVQGVVKVNDTYMNRAPYNTVAEKNHVMCQEVGHTFGLGHQDESGADLGTCMDYSMSLASQHPNAHDYQQLETIYAHLDTTTTVNMTSTSKAAKTSDLGTKQNWGRRVFRAKSGLLEVYERQFSDGSKIVTTVTLVSHN